MYVAVKGGEEAIDNAHALLAHERRGPAGIDDLQPEQIESQLALAVDRVMAEGSLYDPALAALAIKQSRGDLIEAIFLVRAFRTTLPRFGASEPLDTSAMAIERRISATFKDLPGGQVLGPTFDYTHRLIDFLLAAGVTPPAPAEVPTEIEPTPRVTDLLDGEGLIEAETSTGDEDVGDLTRAPLDFPADRDLAPAGAGTRRRGLPAGARLFDAAWLWPHAPVCRRNPLRRGDGRIRAGRARLRRAARRGCRNGMPDGQPVPWLCQLPPQFTRGYGLVFGQSERKAMSMSLVDRALRTREFGEDVVAPAQDEEFVLSHCDNVQATGFVEHLKLPHYVDFQAELGLVRKMRAEYFAKQDELKEAAE